MANVLENEITFRLGRIYLTPFSQDLPLESARSETKETLYTKLSQYNKARVRADKKADSYNLTTLKQIAGILGIRKNQNKEQLVTEILQRWEEHSPE